MERIGKLEQVAPLSRKRHGGGRSRSGTSDVCGADGRPRLRFHRCGIQRHFPWMTGTAKRRDMILFRPRFLNPPPRKKKIPRSATLRCGSDDAGGREFCAWTSPRNSRNSWRSDIGQDAAIPFFRAQHDGCCAPVSVFGLATVQRAFGGNGNRTGSAAIPREFLRASGSDGGPFFEDQPCGPRAADRRAR